MTPDAIYDLFTAAYRQRADRQRAQRAAAFPETCGHPLYLHNWYVCKGDARAIALVARHLDEDRRARALFDRWYRRAEHRVHSRHGFDCSWCEYCAPAAAPVRGTA